METNAFADLIPIPPDDDALLAECDVETFRSSGPGGQNVNRRETAVRLRHRPSGLSVGCQRERTQWRNKQIALSILRKRLEKLNEREAPRVATKMPRSVRAKILREKKRTSAIKKQRRTPGADE
jgi:protein subunit release factor B